MIARIAAWILAAVLLVAGLAKLLDQPAFGRALASVGLLPLIPARVVVLLLPWLEVVVAIALLRPRWRRAGAILALGLALGFTLYSAAGALFHRPEHCGCFGLKPVEAGWGQHILIAVAMVVAAVVVVRAAPSPVADGPAC